jgi:hypothetical protein
LSHRDIVMRASRMMRIFLELIGRTGVFSIYGVTLVR